jgi:hypothetical protein
MLTMRSVGENGFGQKVRDWNRTEMVERWRECWAELLGEKSIALFDRTSGSVNEGGGFFVSGSLSASLFLPHF